MTEYVNREYLEAEGFVKMGRSVYKMNTLERYATVGYLNFGAKRYTAIDRVGAGKRLYRDFYLSGVQSVGAVDMSKIRVDGMGSIEESSRRLHHLDCYQKAMAVVPSEFWPVVRRVCLEDKPLKAQGTKLDIKRQLYALRVDLCRGLDRLCDFYMGRNFVLDKGNP